MPRFDTNDALFAAMEQHLYSAVLSDSLDAAGLRFQALRPQARPLWPEAVVCGRAMPILSVDVYEVPDEPYEKEIAAVDDLRPGEVAVACTDESKRTCLWGELLSTAARARGARGVVLDSYVRDVRRITAMRFPVFATGAWPVDSLGRSLVVDFRVTGHCLGVQVCPGDLVFGDLDGVVVIPRAAEADVLERAFAKVEGENRTREELEKGAYLRDVYAKYGVL